MELIAPRDAKKGAPHFSMGFRVLDDENKILAAVKAEASRMNKARSRSIDIAMPREIAQRSGRSGDVNSLVVPINDRL